MTNRRIYETIGIRYVDVGQMATIVGDIKAMLQQHEDIESDETMIVNFLAFNASSLDIMVYTFTKTTQWIRFHEVKQDVLLKISDIIEGYGAEVAFPTRTLHLPNGVRLNESTSDQSEGSAADESAKTSRHSGTRGEVDHSGDSE